MRYFLQYVDLRRTPNTLRFCSFPMSECVACVPLLQDEQRALKAQFDAIHKDRITVTYQVLPRQVPDYMGAAKVLVSPTAFIPQPQAPSVPMQMGGQDKACVLM